MPIRWPWIRTGNATQSNSGGVNIVNTGVIGSITIDKSDYVIEDFPLHAPPVPDGQAVVPSRLLAARYRVVPFTGRQQELAELARWRDEAGEGMAVLLVHASGGQGKTRLAAEFAASSAAAGWRVVQGLHHSPPTRRPGTLPQKDKPSSAQQGLLVLVDYAERWPTSDLLGLLQDSLLRSINPVRVLLLARPSGLWWEGLRHELGKLEVSVTQWALRPAATHSADRVEIFTAARDRFAAKLGVPDPERILVPDHLHEDAFRSVLTMHMAALVAVDAYRRSEASPADPIGLSAYLLDRERAHWKAMYDQGPVVTSPPTMARVAYVATLTRQMRRTTGVAALAQAGIVAASEVAMAGQLLDDHQLCYPPTDTEFSLEPLYPDRLGEDFLALQTPGHDVGSYTADPWAADAPVRLLAPVDDQAVPVWSGPGMVVLIETARRWTHVRKRYLYPLLRRHPELAIAAGSAALTGLAELPDIEPAVLVSVGDRLPAGRHVDLDVGIAALTQRLVDHLLSSTRDLAQRAFLYGNLGWRLSNAGQHDRAVAATEQAVDLSRQLAEINPAEHQATLAAVLSDFGAELSVVGRRERALATTEEAVALYRRLVGNGAKEHEANLASVLTNLGVMLSGIGRREDALRAVDEAAATYKRLVVADSTQEPGLAMALLNLSSALSNLGRHEDGLAVAQESVEIYRRLVRANRAVHEPELATLLSNLTPFLRALGRRDEALGVGEEAVEVLQRLAVVNPAMYEPTLARALTNVSLALSDLGRHEEAVRVVGEATKVYARLARVNPAAYEDEFAIVLNNFAARLAQVGLRQAALPIAEEAVKIGRRLAKINAIAYEPELAAALNNFSIILSDEGRLSEALDAAEEAVEIRQRLAAADPLTYEPRLALALGNFGERLAELGRWHEALVATEQAVTVLRRLAATNGPAHELELARGLWRFARVRAVGEGQLAEGQEAAEESIGMFQRLVARFPGAFDHDLAGVAKTLTDLVDVRRSRGSSKDRDRDQNYD